MIFIDYKTKIKLRITKYNFENLIKFLLLANIKSNIFIIINIFFFIQLPKK